MKHERDLEKIWSKIPDDTNILITHGPSYGHRDRVNATWGARDPHVGSKSLTTRKESLTDLKYHISGHIHEDWGIDDINVCASVLNTSYNLVNEPIVLTV